MAEIIEAHPLHKVSEALEQTFAGGGETAALLRAIDWSATPLGSTDTWPHSLCCVLSICMNARFPISIYWGAEHIMFYNDAAIPLHGDKHPWALGCPARKVWPELWDVVGRRFKRVMAGEAISGEDEFLPMHRYGYIEECYFDCAASPIRGEGGHVVGIFAPGIETTYRVIAERRGLLLRRLVEDISAAVTAEQVCALAAEALATDPADVPFGVIYLVDDDYELARLAVRIGLDADSQACPSPIALSEHATTHAAVKNPWPLQRAFQMRRMQLVDDLATRIDSPMPGGTCPEPARAAVVVPIPAGSTIAPPAGLLVLGISPRKAFDEQYSTFVTQVAQSLGAAIANARLRDRERTQLRTRLINIANAAPVAIHELRIAPDGRMSMPYSTPAIEDLSGMTPQELAEDFSRALSLIHPEDVGKMQAAYEESRRTLLPLRVEWRVRHPVKGEIWVESSATPESQPDGGTVWYGYFHDVTERRKMEQALREREARSRQLAETVRQFNALLEERVATRTADLEKANLELEQFAHTVSHDLRGPLRSINCFSHLLAQGERERLSTDGHRMLARIETAGARLDRLIDSILDYSRAGLRDMVRRPVALRALAQEVFESLHPQYPHAQLIMGDLPTIAGDPTMLRQVLENLIGNALKFSVGATQPIVEINSRTADGEVIYYVRDNGVGFDPHYTDQLFGMFRRLHNDREFPGTGVGLAIVKRLIERHGGRIWPQSQPGSGATFFFTLGDDAQPEVTHQNRGHLPLVR